MKRGYRGYTVGQTAKILGMSNTSVRNYSKWFSEFFSDAAVPEPGNPRIFDHADITTLATVARLKRQQLDDEAIIATLASGERDPVTIPEDKPPQPEEEPQERTQSTNELTLRLSASLARAEGQLQETTKERDRLITELETERAARLAAEKGAAAANAQLEILKQLTETKQEAEEDRPLTWWQRIFGSK